MKIKMMSTNQEYIIEKVGVFTPKAKDIEELKSGEIGFIITGIKNLSDTKVGDTICEAQSPLKKLYLVSNLVNQLFFVAYFQLIVQSIKN